MKLIIELLGFCYLISMCKLAWFCHQIVYSLSIKEVIQVFLCTFSDLINFLNEVIQREAIIEAPQTTGTTRYIVKNSFGTLSLFFHRKYKEE